MRQGSAFAGLCAVAAGVVVACTTPAQQASAPVAAPQAVAAPARLPGVYAPYVDQASFTAAYRRLTESQYRHAIADAFGPRLTINARFEPEQREDGLQAVGNARLSITTTGMEQYIAVARSIADQVVDGEGRDARIGCTPSAEGAADAACAQTFIKWRGQQLFRRPLSAAETASFASIWESSARQSGDFYKGLKLSLIGMLVSPDFLFRIEKAEADPATPAAYRLDAYSTASRLSFILWDSGPDDELLESARTGEIQTQAGLRRQIDRMTASPRMEAGVRAFFSDMLHFEAFDTLTKDAATYPKFSQAVADSAREETLRFLVDHLVTRGGDYRDIFTARDTILNRPLAAVYGVPYLSAEPWAPYTFDEASERSGILTQVTFLSLFSHPGRSSPTIRGVKLHDIFLCVPTPDPPADVDFSKVQAIENGTVRTRLIDHMTNPGCSTCHRISDPVGLTLEHFDGLGQRRTSENGAPIDVSAEIGTSRFSGAQGLGQYMHDQPLAASCLVRRVNSYGAGKPFNPRDMAWLTEQTQAFGAGGYRMAQLYTNMLSDPRFFRVEAPRGASIRTAAMAGSQGEGR